MGRLKYRDTREIERTREMRAKYGTSHQVLALRLNSSLIFSHSVFCHIFSKNIKLSSTQVHAAEELADEGDEAGAAMANARTKFLTQVVKRNMIENTVPIIIELKSMVSM